MPELWRFDSREWLSTLHVPTLVLSGTADPVVPIAHARAVHEAIPGSRWVAVEDAGHVPETRQTAGGTSICSGLNPIPTTRAPIRRITGAKIPISFRTGQEKGKGFPSGPNMRRWMKT
jgi:fermentation-respiration switch protein FrsA (DUF1100 family)